MARQYKVDEFRERLSQENDDSLMEFVKDTPKNVDVYYYLQDLGYKGSYSSVAGWLKQTRPKGRKVQDIENLLSECGGYEPTSALRVLLMNNQDLLQRGFGMMMDDLGKNDEDRKLSVNEIAKLLPHLQRETRQAEDILSKADYISDRKDAEKSGGYKVIKELELTFQDVDTISHDAFEKACIGALKRLDEED